MLTHSEQRTLARTVTSKPDTTRRPGETRQMARSRARREAKAAYRERTAANAVKRRWVAKVQVGKEVHRTHQYRDGFNQRLHAVRLLRANLRLVRRRVA